MTLPRSSTGIAKSAGKVSIAVFLSRILGLVREQVMAGLFGAGMAMDAFVVAFRIPNLLRDLFAEGALSAAFVTVFADYQEKKSREETLMLVRNVFSAMVIVISVLVILGMVFSEELVTLLAPDFSKIPGKVALAGTLTDIMFPFLLFVSVAAMLMGVLNTKGHFFIPALSSSCFNLSSILIGGGLALAFGVWGYSPILGMAIGTLSGGIAQMAIQLPIFYRHDFSLKPFLKLNDPGLLRIGRLIIPAIIGLSATQINIFVNTNFASRCAEGSVAWLNYAFRLMQFPIGLFGVAISIATLPVISRLAATKDMKAMGDTLVSSLTLALALTAPAAVGLWITAKPLVALIYQHGRFLPQDTLMTAEALRFYAIGLVAYSSVKIIVPAFYALNDTKWPVIASFLSVALNIIIILLTLEPLQHKAIALSTSITMLFNFSLLAFILYKKTGGYPVRRLFVNLLKILAGSAGMGALVFLLMDFLGDSAGLFLLLRDIFLCIAVGAASYAILIYILGISEIREIVEKSLKRIRSMLFHAPE